jgi:ATP-dependent protease ClpP protease subunit
MVLHPVIATLAGNSLQLRKAALELDPATGQILDAVQPRTGQPENIVRSWLNPEKDHSKSIRRVPVTVLASFHF